MAVGIVVIIDISTDPLREKIIYFLLKHFRISSNGELHKRGAKSRPKCSGAKFQFLKQHSQV